MAKNPVTTRSIIGVGTICNLNCKHCYYWGTKRSWKPLPYILANILFLRLCRIDKIDISGGEPSIYRHIDSVVRFCELLWFKEIRLVTNGIAIEKMKELAKHDKVRFSLSFHSNKDEEMFDLTGRRGMIATLKRFISECGEKVNYVNIILTPFNKSIEEIPLAIREIVGDKPLCFKQLHYEFKYSEECKGFTYDKYKKQLNDGIRKLWAKYPDAKVHIRFYPICLMDKDNLENPNIKMCTCKTQAYDQNDWNPIISKLSSPSRILRFIFGNERQREIVSAAQSKTEVADSNMLPEMCHGCLHEEICDGLFVTYHKEFGPLGIERR